MTDLGSSNVAIVPVVEKRPTEFTPTRAEWSADNRFQLVLSRGNVGLGTIDMFTVPNNQAAFITSVNLTARASAIGFAVVDVRISSGTGLIKLLEIELNTSQSGNNTVSFPMPVKVFGGSIIQLVTTADISFATGNVTGWLE